MEYNVDYYYKKPVKCESYSDIEDSEIMIVDVGYKSWETWLWKHILYKINYEYKFESVFLYVIFAFICALIS